MSLVNSEYLHNRSKNYHHRNMYCGKYYEEKMIQR